MNDKTRKLAEQTGVVIPSYNAAPHLAEVVGDTSTFIPLSRIIIVDDGSTDNTLEVANGTGAVVVQHPVNRGKGAALKTGLNKAFEMGFAFAFTIDADGQHRPDEIPRFLECQVATDADIIVGNRMAERKNMPGDRVFANKATSWFVSLRSGVKIPDSQNGYRLIRTAMFKKVEPRLKAVKYEAESEFLIKAAKAGARIESVPVETIYATEVSSVNPYVDTARFLRMAFRSFFW
ncbi:MAG: glycosyltransferase family 2 protein [Candidatus Latescibacterota bacterium]|nr:MAG: glycosyltransferase family 2 protein [Candidatus Latescibacterota bacterium]